MGVTTAETTSATRDDIPRDVTTKEFRDFRDRAAYVRVTGTFPTHVRAHFNALLCAATEWVKGPSSADERFGHVQVSEDVAHDLQLDQHPMVRRVREEIARGSAVGWLLKD